MIRIRLQATDGTLIWSSSTAPHEILELSPFWSAAVETFDFDDRIDSIVDVSIFENDKTVTLCLAITGSIHGRSCYLGFNRNENRHYFAKGIGWIMSTGWQPQDGTSGVLPLWAAERERDFSLEFSQLGIDTVRPEAIFLHGLIPDSQGGEPYPADTIPDLDGTPAKPCLYVYSSPVRRRIADLAFITEKERNSIWTNDKSQWLRSLLSKLGRSCRILHEHGGYDYSLSPHNSFTDGTRIDFEYAVLPGYPHGNHQLNKDADAWKDKEWDGLREIAWYLADMMQLDISGQELNRWWLDAYVGADKSCPP